MRIYENRQPPKYIQIYEWVRHMIRDGRLKVGDRIPTEPDLARRFNSSRMTVRKAIDPLVLEGMVERRQGQGSFVVSNDIVKLTYDPSRPIRFSHDMAQVGLAHRHEVLKVKVIKADKRLQQYLNLAEGARVILINMVLYADGKPMIIENNYFSHEDFHEMLKMDLSVPPLQLLADEFKIEVKKVKQYISAVCAGKNEMKLFGVDYPVPCIFLEWISCDENSLPISVSLCHYRGDAFKFKIPASELVKPDTI